MTNEVQKQPGSALMRRMWWVFFLQGMTQGFWVPVLTNLLGARGMSVWVPWVFTITPMCALISPLMGGALVDQRYSAEKVFGWFSIICSVLLVLTFGALDLGLHPLWFVGGLGLFSLFSSPTWGILATIALTQLPSPEKQFPLARMGATVGWVAGGWITSYVLASDASTLAGYASSVSRLLAGLLAFGLPCTLPQGKAGSWRSRIGLDAFSLFKQRDHAVFFAVTALFSVPISAFYMYAPEFLKFLGDPHPTGTMTLAQILEVFGMVVLGTIMTRYRVKTVLLWAMGLSVLRFGMSAWAGTSGLIFWHVMGAALHGLCYTLFFITGQVFLNRRVVAGMRGQAQGLYAMISGGLGPLAGAWICSWLRATVVGADGSGWDEFWWILAGMVAVCGIWFALAYRGGGKPAGNA